MEEAYTNDPKEEEVDPFNVPPTKGADDTSTKKPPVIELTG